VYIDSIKGDYVFAIFVFMHSLKGTSSACNKKLIMLPRDLELGVYENWGTYG